MSHIELADPLTGCMDLFFIPKTDFKNVAYQ